MYRKKHVIDTAVIHLIWLLAIMAASCSAITDDVPAQDDATLRLNIVSRERGASTRGPSPKPATATSSSTGCAF